MEEKYLQIARRANKIQKSIPNYVPFPCNVTGRFLKIYFSFFLSTIIHFHNYFGSSQVSTNIYFYKKKILSLKVMRLYIPVTSLITNK